MYIVPIACCSQVKDKDVVMQNFMLWIVHSGEPSSGNFWDPFRFELILICEFNLDVSKCICVEYGYQLKEICVALLDCF